MSVINTEPNVGLAPELFQVNPPHYHLWDFAGVDGLQVAIALFAPTVNHISPFQSLTSNFNQQPCAILRLCENNFRVALPAEMPFDQAVADLELNVWVKPCQATTIVLPVDFGLQRLAQIATTKPTYTLNPFPLNQAVPARINGIAILAWHHPWQGQPKLVIQTAATDADAIRATFS
ncbi:MAG: hypothetical protein AAF215_01260 [Cyanobacteria bacterium P01_A01_bin.123]